MRSALLEIDWQNWILTLTHDPWSAHLGQEIRPLGTYPLLLDTRDGLCGGCQCPASSLSCRSLVTQDFLDYCCGVGGYVGLGGDGLTGDLDGDLA